MASASGVVNLRRQVAVPPLTLLRRAATLGVLVVCAVLLHGWHPAAAHPFGAPQQMAVDLEPGEDAVVRVRWRVGGTDDLTLLGIALGLLPEDRVMVDGAVFFEEADATTLAASPEFADYLLRTITVSTADGVCTGRLHEASELATRGLTLLFDCPGVATESTVAGAMLVDLHPQYRTMASGPDGQRAVYSNENPRHTWTLRPGAAAETGGLGDAERTSVWRLGALVGGAAVGGLAVWRRRARRAGS